MIEEKEGLIFVETCNKVKGKKRALRDRISPMKCSVGFYALEDLDQFDGIVATIPSG